MTDGNNVSSTPIESNDKPLEEKDVVTKEIEDILERLDKYEEDCGLPTAVNENTTNLAAKLLNTDFSSFNKSTEECKEAAACLAQYAFNLQRVINREKSIVLLCTEKIKVLSVPYLKNEKSYHREERAMNAIMASVKAKAFYQHKVQAELRLSRIESIYFAVKHCADKFSSFAFSRKEQS